MVWPCVTHSHADINNKRCQYKIIASCLVITLFRAWLRDVSDCVVDENWLHVAKSNHHETRDGVKKQGAQEEFEHNPKEKTPCILF